MNDEQLKNWLEEKFPEEADLLFAVGLSPAFIGVTNCEPRRCVYSVPRIIRLLVEEENMTEEKALEHLQFNIVGGYVGERTPVFVHTHEP